MRMRRVWAICLFESDLVIHSMDGVHRSEGLLATSGQSFRFQPAAFPNRIGFPLFKEIVTTSLITWPDPNQQEMLEESLVHQYDALS